MKLKAEEFAKNRLHKLRAKKYYMKEKNENVIKVCFEIQHIQPN